MLFEGSHLWGQDNWCYVVRAGRPVRTSYFRNFPNRYNPNLYDLYDNGRFIRRVGAMAPRATAPAVARQLSPEELRLQRLVYELQQQTAANQAAAGSGRYVPGGAGTIGGFSLNTPNVNPLTVSSVPADAIRAQGTPMAQVLSLINMLTTGRR